MSTDIHEDQARQKQLNNLLMGDWDRAMDGFYEAAHKQMGLLDMTQEEVSEALNAGYGWEVAEGWDEWMDQS